MSGQPAGYGNKYTRREFTRQVVARHVARPGRPKSVDKEALRARRKLERRRKKGRGR